MGDRRFSTSRGLRLLLLFSTLLLCLLVIPTSSKSLRGRSKGPQTDEEAVTFADEDPSGPPSKEDVPIKRHDHGKASAEAESQSAGSEAEDRDGSSAEASGKEDESFQASEAESQQEEAGAPKRRRKEAPSAADGKKLQESSPSSTAAESAAESAAASAGETASDSAAEGPKSDSAAESPQAPETNTVEGRGAAKSLPEETRVVTQTEMAGELKSVEHPTEEARELTREAIKQKLQALGAPFTLGKQHFSLDFQHGLKLDASDFESASSQHREVLWRAASEEPKYTSEKSLFLAIDIDEGFIGTDVRLVQLFVKPEACTVQAEGACKTAWFLREPTPASPPHRIVVLAFSSPTAKKFQFDDLLKRIQQHPTDIDLRRISLQKFFEAHASFFNDEQGKISAASSWTAFAMTSHTPGDDQPLVDHPLVSLPENATAEQKAAAIQAAADNREEIDNLTAPEHGGESPGAGGNVSASTVFKNEGQQTGSKPQTSPSRKKPPKQKAAK